MDEPDRKEDPLGIKGLLGLGLDGADGHTRITKGENFILYGGSQKTHERMQQTALRFNEEIEKRGKRIEEINGHELEDIVDNLEDA